MGARITVSSMRTDPISVPLVRAMAASGTQTLTIAPEAGTERLRTVISKRQTEADLLAAVELAQSLGFPLLKMYFMVGHPTENDDDIQGIVDLTLKARADFSPQHRHQRHAVRAQGAHTLPMDGDDARQDAPGAPEDAAAGAGEARDRGQRGLAGVGRGAGRFVPRRPPAGARAARPAPPHRAASGKRSPATA